MRALKQIAAVTLMNIKSVPLRLGASSVIVIGIAGVVGVLVSILAMVGGLSQMMTSTGRAHRAIVVMPGHRKRIRGSDAGRPGNVGTRRN